MFVVLVPASLIKKNRIMISSLLDIAMGKSSRDTLYIDSFVQVTNKKGGKLVTIEYQSAVQF